MTPEAFATVLASTARELETLAGLAADIDHAIGQLSVPATIGGRATESLQRIDLLRQSLECIALYVNNLARQLKETNHINPASAAESLALRDLARNLASPGQIDSAAEQTTCQDVCFF